MLIWAKNNKQNFKIGVLMGTISEKKRSSGPKKHSMFHRTKAFAGKQGFRLKVKCRNSFELGLGQLRGYDKHLPLTTVHGGRHESATGRKNHSDD
jgi:hypothetical protein